MTNLDTNVIQVTNVSPTITIEQMTTFFNFVGSVHEVIIYPKEDNNSIQTQSKTCYIRFKDSNSVKIAQHLSNTVFIDRALVVTPVLDDKIPDESTSYSLTSGLNVGNNEGLINQVVTGNNGQQVISTMDPRLSALGLPQYPVLPSNTDPSKIEEIRRTIQITNLDSTVTGEDVLRFFNQIGEVKYVRLNTNDNIPSNLTKLQVALIEFTEQASVASALQSNGSLLGHLPIKVSHSTQPIIKPLGSRNSNTQQKEIEEAMRRVRDSQMIEQPALIKLENILQLTNEHNKSINATAAGLNDKKSSRSRSRSRRRSTSRNRRRSRSRESYRRRYEDRYRKSRSPTRRSPTRRSRTPKSDRDRDPKYDERRRRHRSRSRESYRRRYEDRYDERRRQREQSRSSDRLHRHRDRSKDRDYRRDRDKRRSKERSPAIKHSSRSSRELKVENDQTRRREKVIRDDEDDNNLMMDQDLNMSKGPITPPSIESFKFKKTRDDDSLRRSLSNSPVKERRKERKNSKEKRKKKDKRKASSDEESDNSIDNEQEPMEH